MKYYNSLVKERIGYDFYCDIAERIVEGRKQNDWTQERIAEEAGLSVNRIRSLEGVKTRITISDVNKIAKALGVSSDWLIDAELDFHGKECLYLVWNEKLDEFKPYQTATSSRMAFLKAYQRICFECYRRWFEPRDRAIVQLVGVPIEQAELESMLPKRREQDDALE